MWIVRFMNLRRRKKVCLHAHTDSPHIPVLVTTKYMLHNTNKPKGPEQTIMLAMMQPAPTPEAQADLDKWYRDEHNAQMSKEPGYLRTSRYRLLNQTSNGGSETQELSFLAVHGFDEGNVLGTEIKPLDPMTEWTKKVMGQAVGIDAGIYGLVRVFGA